MNPLILLNPSFLSKIYKLVVESVQAIEVSTKPAVDSKTKKKECIDAL